MAQLWLLLTNELGQGFRSQFGDEGGESFKYWSKQLESFSAQEIYRGVERWVLSGDPFINVNKIRKLCQPLASDYGLPSVEEAYRIALSRDWEKAHPALQVVLSERMYDIRRMSDHQARGAFHKIYQEIVRRVAAGEQFKRPPSLAYNPSGTVHTKSAESQMKASSARAECKRLVSEMKCAIPQRKAS